MSEDGKYIWDGNSWTAISDIKDSKSQNHPTPGLPLTMSPGMPLPEKQYRMKNKSILFSMIWNLVTVVLSISLVFSIRNMIMGARKINMLGEEVATVWGGVSNETKTLEVLTFYFFIGLIIISALVNIYQIYKIDRKNS